MKIAVIPGDGIGKDVTAEAVKVLQAVGEWAGRPLTLEHLPWSADYYLQTGITIPPNGYDMLRDDFDAVFLGALGDPRVVDNRHARDILLGARFELDLYAVDLGLRHGFSHSLPGLSPLRTRTYCRPRSPDRTAGPTWSGR